MALVNNSVNGQEYQHALVGLELATTNDRRTIKKFHDIKYDISAEKKPVHDNEGQIVSYTIDNEKPTGSFKLLLSTWNEIEEWAQDQFPDIGLGQIEFLATVTYGNTQAKLKKDKFAFLIQKNTRESSDNQDKLVIDVPLFVWKVKLNNGEFIKYST